MKEELLSSVCRCCLLNPENVSPLIHHSSSSLLSPFSSNLQNMFTECTNIQLSKGDGLSICPQCAKNIEFCYEFINTCRATDAALKSYRRKEGSVKEEDEEDEEINIKQELVELPFRVVDNDNFDLEDAIKIEVEYDDDDDDDDSMDETISVKKLKKMKHVKKVPRKEYSCPVCDATIIGKGQYNDHLATQHESYRKYICPHCKKGFAKSHYLSQHIIIHTDLRPYACDKCPKTYKQRGQLYIHKRLHAQEKPYSCEKCGVSFKLKGILDKHSLLHQGGEPNLCHLCGAGFSQVGNLVVHMRSHTGEKPYSCSQCSFRCSVQSGLKRHERIHANLKAYICNICQKGFNNSSSLSRHSRIHTGELPYKCDYCPKAFVDSWKRKTHLVKAHNLTLDNIPKMIPGRKRVYDNKKDEDANDVKPELAC